MTDHLKVGDKVQLLFPVNVRGEVTDVHLDGDDVLYKVKFEEQVKAARRGHLELLPQHQKSGRLVRNSKEWADEEVRHAELIQRYASDPSARLLAKIFESGARLGLFSPIE